VTKRSSRVIVVILVVLVGVLWLVLRRVRRRTVAA
jgi:hypothetical protein